MRKKASRLSAEELRQIAAHKGVLVTGSPSASSGQANAEATAAEAAAAASADMELSKEATGLEEESQVPPGEVGEHGEDDM